MSSPTSPAPGSTRSPFRVRGRGVDLALFGALGAVFGLFFFVEMVETGNVFLRDALAGALIGGSLGFWINAADPWRDGAYRRLARAASWGALAGTIGGAAGLVVGEAVLGGFQGGLLGRASSWAILGLGIGASQGLAGRSAQRLRLGLIGGGLGGLLGGFLFEALRERLGDRYEWSQGPGMVVLGGGLGLCLAWVESVLGRAWVRVLNGRQEGRSYLLAAKSSRLGLDERAEVGLFGDPTVRRDHAEIRAEGRDFVLLARDGHGATRLNGRVVSTSAPLRDGDRIELGTTLLTFRAR